MRYVNYIGNLAQVAVELANGENLTGLQQEFFRQHRIRPPDPDELAPLMPSLRAAVAAVADGGPVTAVNTLLQRFPPHVHVSNHDMTDSLHLHFARDGEDPSRWLGRSCAAALAHVICGDPDVTVGRCHAAGCPHFYVDQSRNRSRRFCSAACASRTTVAAYRARRNKTEPSAAGAEDPDRCP